MSEEDNPKKTIEQSDIDAKAANMENILGKSFDKEQFQQDAQLLKEDGGSLDSLNIGSYTKKNDNGGPGLSFGAIFKDGEYVATSPDGKVIRSKDMDDFNKQLATEFKNHGIANGEEPKCTFESNIRDPEKRKKESESFARNFINEGVVVKGDLPQDPKFWNDLKKDYLNNKENTPENWDRLTRFVPPKSMDMENASQRPITPSLGKHVTSMRKGVNLKLTPAQPKTVRQTTLSQNNVLDKFQAHNR